MVLDSKELGQRLKDAREACQITQETVGKVLGVSRVTIAQIEGGNRPINTLQLEKLARLYKRDVSDFFAPIMAREREATAVFFRITQELRQKVDRKALALHFRLLREFTRLESLLGLSTRYKKLVKYEFAEPHTIWDAITIGQKMAEEERKRLQLGMGPISDISELLEIQGIRVLEVEMNKDISGVFMGDAQMGLAVFVNPEHHSFRRSFTLAHEYCHVLADRDRSTVISSLQTEKDLIEVRANAFAAAFLLPKLGVEEFFGSLGKLGATREHLAIRGLHQLFSAEQRKSSKTLEIQFYDIVYLQHSYGVSWEVVIYRLQNLGLLTKEEAKNLLTKKEEARSLSRLVKMDLKDNALENPSDRSNFPVRFFMLGIEAYRQALVSFEKLKELMEMIGIHPNKLNQLLKNTSVMDGGV